MSIETAALIVEEVFWRTFPHMEGRPYVLKNCILDLRKELQKAGHVPEFDDTWIERRLQPTKQQTNEG